MENFKQETATDPVGIICNLVTEAYKFFSVRGNMLNNYS